MTYPEPRSKEELKDIKDGYTIKLMITTLTIGILLSGCGITPKYETGTLVWVGCHRVEQNPSPEGSTSYFLLTPSKIGDKLYLQQVGGDGRAIVTVGEKCK